MTKRNVDQLRPSPGQFVPFDEPVTVTTPDGTKTTSYTGFLLRTVVFDPSRKRCVASTSIRPIVVWTGAEYDAHAGATMAEVVETLKPLVLAALRK